MLKGIDALIGPDLLHVLAQMGHGDEIAIVDANFPAVALARHTVHGVPLRMDCGAVRALQAVLTLLPLDDFQPDPVTTMQIVGDAVTMPDVVAEALPCLAAEGAIPTGVERFAFYERTRQTFAILWTTEQRPYGNFILRKGVIFG